jgi:hypothetical protein
MREIPCRGFGAIDGGDGKRQWTSERHAIGDMLLA